jgi:alpha-L-arabinofuranosidase
MVVKIVNVSANTIPVVADIRGVKPTKKQASLQELFSTDQLTVNNFEAPTAIAPVNGTVPVKGNAVSLSIKPYSLTVIRIPCK